MTLRTAQTSYLVLFLGVVALAGVVSCGISGSSNTSGTAANLQSGFSVTNGFGAPLLPLRVHVPDSAGNPTSQIVEIRDLTTLTNNKPSSINPVLPVATWPTTAVLPSNEAGNQFVLIDFGPNFVPDEKSVLNPLSSTGQTGSLTITALDPTSGLQTNITGRLFVNGRTTRNGKIETWVVKGPAVATTLPEPLKSQVFAGFPGIAHPFTGAEKLVSKHAVVFVPDSDNDLSTFETFPQGANIRISVGKGVRSTGGHFWPNESVAVSTVGGDTLSPEVSVNPGTFTPVIDPALNATLVPVTKQVTISFTESVQPYSVGPLPSQLPPAITGGIRLSFTIGTNTVTIPFTALPESPYNFARIILTPAFQFPGSFFQNGPSGLPTPQDVVFKINIDATTLGTVFDLANNSNAVPRASAFTTAPGTGLVNAPVSPAVIYLGFGGVNPGVGVLDLDGFGQGTGTPVQDNPTTLAIEPGTTNFPNNPDLNLSLTPPLIVESTPLAGGSLGPLTLARDSSGVNFVFAQAPVVNGVRDMAIGMPLDTVFNNGICQSGGGNFCAKDSFQGTQGNNISTEPAPNPPKLSFPPLCLAPFIGGIEPVSVINPGTSLLKPGNFKGNPQQGIPPQGLFTSNPFPYGGVWPGPFPAPTSPPFNCGGFAVRQQIGHFLYVVDPVVRRIVVLNSNRMTVVTSIPQPDPSDLAMAPTLKVLAVSNFSTNQVQFIGTDPLVNGFHQVVAVTPVGSGPAGIAWQPDNEDIFVCNTLSNTVSILEGQSFKIRKTISNQLQQPFQVALTSRQLAFGFQTGVYFGYILNKNGTCAVFESGPAGLQGIGFDDLVGLISDTFFQPTAVQVDTNTLESGVWIVHKTSTGLPTCSNLVLSSSPVGPIPFNNFIIFPSPSFRNREWKVVSAISPNQFSGQSPQDIALDDTLNIGSMGVASLLSGGLSGPAIPHSAKRQVRFPNGAPTPASGPKVLFFSHFDAGAVDVIDRVTGLKIMNPIAAPAVQKLCHYWRE